MAKLLRKAFGGLNIKWWHVVVFAVLAGVYTGVMALLPAARDTSFQDISISFECWILFAILLIVNSRSPLDSALKVFVFFLISQPLVYLVQVPFSELGWSLFRYYPPWLMWTLLTFPMAFVGHFMKKDKWWGLLILGPMMVFLGYHYFGFFKEAVHFFPNHLLSAVFCVLTMFLYPLFIFRDKKIRIAGAVLAAVILLAASVLGLLDKNANTYDTMLLPSGSETCGIEYDDSYTAYLADPEYGEAHVEYVESIEDWMIAVSFEKTGDTELILEAPDGTKTYYTLHVERYSYDVKRKE